MAKCLYCYKELNEGEKDFHKACSKRMFSTPGVPELPYTRENLTDLAKQVISSQTTLTGVQAKLSLDINKSGRNETDRFTIVGLWGRYILKPQTDRFAHLPELEDLTMHLAELAKMQVVPHSLIRFSDGELCYITRRIDRTNKGDTAIFGCAKVRYGKLLGTGGVFVDNGQCRYAPEKLFAI